MNEARLNGIQLTSSREPAIGERYALDTLIVGRCGRVFDCRFDGITHVIVKDGGSIMETYFVTPLESITIEDGGMMIRNILRLSPDCPWPPDDRFNENYIVPPKEVLA